MPSLRLPPRLADAVGLIGVCVVMGCVMSATMTALNLGFEANFIAAWLRGWAIGTVVAVPTGALVIPPLMRWVTLLRDGGEKPAAELE